MVKFALHKLRENKEFRTPANGLYAVAAFEPARVNRVNVSGKLVVRRMLPEQNLSAVSEVVMPEATRAHSFQNDTFDLSSNFELDNVWKAIAEPFQVA
jgi:hypothetical protein